MLLRYIMGDSKMICHATCFIILYILFQTINTFLNKIWNFTNCLTDLFNNASMNKKIKQPQNEPVLIFPEKECVSKHRNCSKIHTL